MATFVMEKWTKFLKAYPWGVLVVAYGIVEIVLKVAGNASASAKAVRWLLENGTRVDQGKVVPAGWLVIAVTAGIVGFAIFLIAYIITQRKLSFTELSLTNNAGLKTLDEMFGATSKIRNSLWPQNLKPPHTFTAIKRRHLIYTDFTVSSHNEYHIKALSGPVHYYVWSVSPEPEATPVDHLHKIDFRVKDITPSGNLRPPICSRRTDRAAKRCSSIFYLCCSWQNLVLG